MSILRTIKGFEDFNEADEVLEMLKGGFGLIDAPNLFTSRANEIFVEKGLKPTCAEPKIYLKWRTQSKEPNKKWNSWCLPIWTTSKEQVLNMLCIGCEISLLTHLGVTLRWSRTTSSFTRA